MVIFPVWRHWLAKCQQILGCTLSDAFTTTCSFSDLTKDRWRAVYFNNQKTLHLIFKAVKSEGFLFMDISMKNNKTTLFLKHNHTINTIELDADTRLMIDRASTLRCRGYRTSSLTMLSKTSSSSSPGNGDYKQIQMAVRRITSTQQITCHWQL